METLDEAIQKYADILAQEEKLTLEKKRLRTLIRERLMAEGCTYHRSSTGNVAQLATRAILSAREEPILRVLNARDFLDFASFTPSKVSRLLVPKYGREALLGCFDISRTEVLAIRRERVRDSFSDIIHGLKG